MPKAIETVYHGHTETKPARVVATDSDNNRIIITDDHHSHVGLDSEQGHRRAAEALRDKMGWTGELIGGGTKRGYVWVFLPDERIMFEQSAITQLVILRNDAEMALSGQWDRSDDGFQSQIQSIDEVLAKAPQAMVDEVIKANPVPADD